MWIDLPGRGRPCTLTKEQKIIVFGHIEKSPRSLNKVIADLEQEFDMPLSIDIIKGVCKTAGIVWKRESSIPNRLITGYRITRTDYHENLAGIADDVQLFSLQIKFASLVLIEGCFS